MPFVPAPNIVRVAMVFQDTSGNEAVNVLHVRNDNDPTSLGRMASLAGIIAAWAAAEWAPLAAVAWSLVRLEMRALDEQFGLVFNQSYSIAGTEDGQALPSQNTIAVSLRSAFSGRSRRGRLYFVGLSEAAVNGDYLIGTSRDVIIAAYVQLLEDLNAGEWTWGILSYIENGVVRTTPLFTNINDIIITDDVIDSMDKRKPGN